MGNPRIKKLIVAFFLIALGLVGFARLVYPAYVLDISHNTLRFVLLFNDVNKQDSMGFTSLHYCAMVNHSERLKYLIDRGGNTNIKDQFGQFPINLAIMNGSECSIELLLSNDIKNNLSEVNNILISLAEFGYGKRFIEKIISNGADVNALDSEGIAVLYHAIWNENRETFCVLLKNGADVFRSGANTKCPFEAAMMMKDRFYFNYIIDRISIDAKDDYGETLLHKAATYGQIDHIKTLIEKGADPNLKTKRGETVLDVAEFCHMPEEDIVIYLKSLTKGEN